MNSSILSAEMIRKSKSLYLVPIKPLSEVVQLVTISPLKYLLSPPWQLLYLLYGASIDPFPDPRRGYQDGRLQGLDVI